MMKQRKQQHELLRKITMLGLFTALTVVFGMIKIPVMGGTTVKMDLPVVVLGAVILGPLAGAWLTVIPTLITFFTGEAALFMTYSPFGTLLTLFLKGVLAGLLAGLVYKAVAKKHPIGAVTCASIVAPVVNSGIFLLGCYVFIWEHLVELAEQNHVSMAVLLLGLVVINFVIELVMNLVLCPAVFRVIQIATKNKHT